MNNFSFLKAKGKKAIVIFALAVSIAILFVGGTIAFVVVGSESIQNFFTPAQMKVVISGEVIENQSEIPVYARAAVVLTWVAKETGVTLSEKPTSDNYVIIYNESAGWFKASDGYWYYTDVLGTDENTKRAPKLLTVQSVTGAPDGYVLSVEILTTVIQSNPPEAVTSSWNAVDITNGKLVKK